jgi:hypothetical protein
VTIKLPLRKEEDDVKLKILGETINDLVDELETEQLAEFEIVLTDTVTNLDGEESNAKVNEGRFILDELDSNARKLFLLSRRLIERQHCVVIVNRVANNEVKDIPLPIKSSP